MSFTRQRAGIEKTGAEPELEEPSVDEVRHQSWKEAADGALVRVGDQQFRIHDRGGGLVSVLAVVAPSVYVGQNAVIKDRAVVVGSVRLFGHSTIEGMAIVADACTLRENACIGGQAIVRGRVNLAHYARIDGDARVDGELLLQHYAHISRGVLSGTMTVH